MRDNGEDAFWFVIVCFLLLVILGRCSFSAMKHDEDHDFCRKMKTVKEYKQCIKEFNYNEKAE